MRCDLGDATGRRCSPRHALSRVPATWSACQLLTLTLTRCGAVQRGRALNTPERRGGGGVSEGGWAGEARGYGLVVRCWCWALVLVLRELHYAALQDPGAGMEANV